VTSSQVSQSSIVNCWRKADILDNKNIDYSIDLNNFELDIFFKEEIQKVTVDYVKALEKYRKDYVELEEVDYLDYDFEKYLNCDNDAQTFIDMTDEEIVNFGIKKTSVEIEEELEELSLENETKIYSKSYKF
jgi:hypothetical protein